MSRRVYLSRDYYANAVVDVNTRKPQQRGTIYYSMGGHLIDLCPDDLVRVTGFKIKPGECKRVRIEIKEV